MTNRVINAAAQGLTSRSFHAHFHDVNPTVKGERRTVAFYAKEARYEIRHMNKARKRIDKALAGGAKILPSVHFHGKG